MPGTIDYTTFMDYGLGFDTVASTVRGLAVKAAAPAAVSGTGGQTVSFYVNRVETMDDVQKAMGISVDGSASLGWGGGSEKFDFSQKSSVNSYSVYMIVTVTVLNSEQHIMGETLVPGLADMVSSNPAEFRAAYGDCYIKGIQAGGEFYGVVEIQTLDSTDQQTISNQLDASGFFGAAKVDTTFTDSFQKTVGNHTLVINAFQRGGQGETAKQYVDIGTMLQHAMDFPSAVAVNPVPYRADLQDYVSLGLPPPPNALDIANAKQVLADDATKRAMLLQFRNDIDYIRKHEEQFDPATTSLDALDAEAVAALNKIETAASACLNDLKSCAFITVAMPDLGQLPKRKDGGTAVIPPVPPPKPAQPIVHGAILARWTAAGGASGMFGQPLTSEAPAPNGGFFNDFEHGYSIYWTQTTGAHWVHGGIKAKWLAEGGAGGHLGYPTTDEMPQAAGKVIQRFEHGGISWTQQGGSVLIA